MRTRAIALATAALLAAGCDTFSRGPLAEAQVKGPDGSRVWGRVTFHQPEGSDAAGRVFVRADINGLPPGRTLGIHVHEKGACLGPDFASAGDHFNPDGKPHGGGRSPERHAGDLPNLAANGEGIAMYSATTDLLTVAPGPRSIIGRSVVIHANPDDYRTQPSGNSGPRIACGVIVEKG
jgi:Cu-Zn family superoxide dismutase